MTALVCTHGQADRFGGALGVVRRKQVAAGRVPMLAPEGFLAPQVAERMIAGNAMGRPARSPFGAPPAMGPHGRVAMRIGPALPAVRITLVLPTEELRQTGETRVPDGVRFEFRLTPGTGAPAGPINRPSRCGCGATGPRR